MKKRLRRKYGVVTPKEMRKAAKALRPYLLGAEKFITVALKNGATLTFRKRKEEER